MTKYKKIIYVLIAINIMAISIGFYIRQSKLVREEKIFLSKSEKTSDNLSQIAGISKEESQNTLLISRNMLTSKSISDKNLEILLSNIRKYDDKLQYKKCLINYSDGFLILNTLPPNQRRKIAMFLVEEISDCTDKTSVMFALRIVSISNTPEIASRLDSVKLQYTNTEVKEYINSLKLKIGKR